MALATGATAPGSLTAQQPTGDLYDEGFFEVYVQRLPARVTVTTLVDARGAVLIPLRPVLELVGIAVAREGDALVLEWPPETWRTVLRPSDRTLRSGDGVRTVEPSDWVARDDDLYLSSGVLSDVLAARVDVDWAGLGIVISGNLEFPATRRLEREARRERLRLMAERLRPVDEDLPFEPRTGGLAASWGVSLAGVRDQYRGAVRTAVGGSLWGGATEVGGVANVGGTDGGSLDDGYARYSRAFPGGSLVRQVQVGSVLSDGPLARRIVGVTLTNEPYTTPRFFGEALIDPAVPAGWEYEVYQGDVLVGVSSGDAPGDLRAPINYGNTPVRVRLIGPSGQEQVEELLYVVPPSRVPEGAWRWSVGGGPCQDPACASYAYGELERGVASWLTAGVGVDRLDPSEGGAEVRPFGSLSLSPLLGLNLDTRVQPGAFVQTGVDYATASSGTYAASYAWTRPAGDAPTLDGWFAQVSATAPVALWGGRSVSGRVQLRGADRSAVESWLVTAATTVRRSYVSATWESGLQERSVLTTRAFAPFPGASRLGVHDLAVSAGLGVSRRGGELLEVGASMRPTANGTLSLDLQARRGGGPVFSVGFALRRPEGYAQGRASTGRGAGLFLSADGGLAYDPDTGVVPLPFQSLGRAGVRGRVYHDVDGDGAFTRADEPAVGVDVVVRGERVTTDEAGAWSTWEARPYDAVEVAVDSLSVDPSWVPAPRVVRLRPSPNMFNRVDLALQRTREVSGQVLLGEGAEARPVGGVQVRVVGPDGTVVGTARTFSDGVYYFQRIPPGTWVVEVAPASLQAVGADAAAARATIRVSSDADAVVEVPTLRLAAGEV